MEDLHRIEIAKQRLRKKLSIEYIRSIEKYKDINEEEYEKLINTIEGLSMVFIQSYIKGLRIEDLE